MSEGRVDTGFVNNINVHIPIIIVGTILSSYLKMEILSIEYGLRLHSYFSPYDYLIEAGKLSVIVFMNSALYLMIIVISNIYLMIFDITNKFSEKLNLSQFGVLTDIEVSDVQLFSIGGNSVVIKFMKIGSYSTKLILKIITISAIIIMYIFLCRELNLVSNSVSAYGLSSLVPSSAVILLIHIWFVIDGRDFMHSYYKYKHIFYFISIMTLVLQSTTFEEQRINRNIDSSGYVVQGEVSAEVNVLFVLEKGILAKSIKDKTIVFYPWDSVSYFKEPNLRFPAALFHSNT